MADALLPRIVVEEPEPPPLWSIRSIRFQIALLIGGAMMVFGLMRGSMSMAIVCMVAPTNASDTDWKTSQGLYPTTYQVDWTVEEQARIHTSFYIGALVSVFVADTLCKRLGAKNLMSLGLLIDIIGSLLTPRVTIWLGHYIYVSILRFLMGFGSGFVIPCGSVIIAKWFPVAEKSTAMAIFTTGNQIGIGVSMLLTAKICQVDIHGGWPLAFVLYGVVAALFLVLWHFRAANKPRESNYITAIELELIVGKRQRRSRANTAVGATPYMKIILSPCVVAICLCSFAQSFVLVALITYLPRYYQTALQMDLNSNGIWSAIPFFVQMITKLLFGTVADLIKKKGAGVTLVTIVANSIASFGSAVCILIVSMLGASHSTIVMLLMCTSMGLFSGYVPGYNTSIVSVAPQYTAFISSYGQLYAQAASTLAPYVIALITQKGTLEEWRYVFYILSGVLIFTGAFFVFFGHGRAEVWGESLSNRTSINLSICPNERTSASMDLEKINAEHRESSIKERLPKKMSRVSYCDSTSTMLKGIPERMEDLPNDVICDIEEESD